jgi:hypothetical protein
MFSSKKKKDEKELHALIVLDGSGHTETTYDPTNPVEVQRVREEFDSIVAASHPLTYKSENGEHEVIKDFDPTAKEIYVTPQNQGG